jgi:hypothetical protein
LPLPSDTANLGPASSVTVPTILLVCASIAVALLLLPLKVNSLFVNVSYTIASGPLPSILILSKTSNVLRSKTVTELFFPFDMKPLLNS